MAARPSLSLVGTIPLSRDNPPAHDNYRSLSTASLATHRLARPLTSGYSVPPVFLIRVVGTVAGILSLRTLDPSQPRRSNFELRIVKLESGVPIYNDLQRSRRKPDIGRCRSHILLCEPLRYPRSPSSLLFSDSVSTSLVYEPRTHFGPLVPLTSLPSGPPSLPPRSSQTHRRDSPRSYTKLNRKIAET